MTRSRRRRAAVWIAPFALALVPAIAHAQVPVLGSFFRGDLTNAQVVPPTASAATAFASLALTSDEMGVGGAVIGSGLGSAVSAVHIHGPAASGTPGPVLLTFDGCGSAASFTCFLITTAVTPTQAANLRAGLWYVDVHSAGFPDGEVRAQLVPDAPLRANLSGAQVSPATGSAATGFGWFSVSADNQRMVWSVSVSGFSGALTADLHGPALPGASGPLLMVLGSSPGTFLGLTSAGVVAPTLLAHLRASQAYIDVHTAAFPGGEARGQVNTPTEVTDFDADGGAELGVLRRFNATPWYLLNHRTGAFTAHTFGVSTDYVTPGDYDGDGKTDRAVYRVTAPGGTFHVWSSSISALQSQPFGAVGDLPISADYDGDGKTDFAVWRPGPGSGVLYVLQSASRTLRAVQWGDGSVDVPLSGDYDGDRKADFVVYRWSENIYYVLRSSLGFLAQPFGISATDWSVPGDYDGDGKTDFAVWRGYLSESDGVWYILLSSTGALRATQFGVSGEGDADLAVPADYDGDGKTDIAVVRNVGGTLIWFILQSSTDTLKVATFGLNGDLPVQLYQVR